ncbi:MAG: MFS transporter [Proteobacteria bacterium]|nr:MFS transporter [Pseudomonadota bacterium]
MAKAERKVTWWELAAFAAPSAPLTAMTLPSTIFLPPYFATHLGIPLSIVSAIFIGVRMLDIIVDPGIGNMQDRTHVPLGRRRFWMLMGLPFMMASIWCVYIGLWPGVPIPTAAAAVVFMFVSYATMAIAHLAWSGELVPTYHGRTHVLGAVQVASMIGSSLMLIIAGYVAFRYRSDLLAVYAMGWTIIALLPVTVLACVALVQESPRPPQPHLTLWQTLKTLAKNKLAQRVLVPDLLLGFAQGISGGLFIFYFEFVLGFEHQAQTMLAIYFLSGLAGVPLWWFLARKLGKHRTLQLLLLYSVLTTALLSQLPRENFALAAPFMFFAGLPFGGGVLLTRSLMADVVDEDEVRTGARRSGIYFGILLTTSKVGIALGPLTYIALEISGFRAALGAHNTPEALQTLTVLFIAGPLLLYLLAALSLHKYPLDEKRHAELAATIAARHAGEA